jgi:hypothetical protein
LLLRYPQKKKYCDLGHSFRWILKCRRNINRVTMTESLFLKIVSTDKNPMLHRPALRGNWNALILASKALKDKFPTPTVPLTAGTKSSGISAGPCIITFRYRCQASRVSTVTKLQVQWSRVQILAAVSSLPKNWSRTSLQWVLRFCPRDKAPRVWS